MRNSFKNLTFKELLEKREEFEKELMALKFKSVTGHIENPLLKRTLRRSVARINTRLYELELSEIKKNE